MRGWRIWAVVAFVVGLAAAMFVYLRTLPAVTEEELREVVAELEDMPALLDELECERPALLGAPTQDALSLEDLLDAEGPFWGCWTAVGSDEWEISIAEGALEGYVGDEAEDRERVAGIVDACSALPAEVGLQARTPDRCMPSSVSSDRWQHHLDGHITERTEALLGTALAMIVSHSPSDTDAKLRLLVQGIATARDFGQGPTGHTARLGAKSERLLARLFSEVLSEESPSQETRAELHEALTVLAEMPIDFRTLVISGLVWCLDTSTPLASNSDWPGLQDEVRSEAYAAATMIPRVVEVCAPDTTILGCANQFPFPLPNGFPPLPHLFGPRAIREEQTLFLQARQIDGLASTAFLMRQARNDARALQQLLQWSTNRAEGRCPELSNVETPDLGEDGTEFRVERNGDVYELLTPGPERDGFLFRCPLGGADDTTGAEDL